MLDKSFGLLFYLKKPKNYKKGDIPIYLRITVDGIPKELSIKRSCDPSRWNSSAGRALGFKEQIKTLNQYLDTYELRVFEAKRKLIEVNKIVTAGAIKDALLGNEQRNMLLIKIFNDYNDRIKRLIGIDYSRSTWIKYDRTRRFTADFIRWKYNADDIHIRQLDFEFITQCELYYKTNRNCCHNTTMKYLSILKSVVLFCKANRWIDHDPFALFEMAKEEVEPTFLTKDEIQTLANKPILIDRLKRVRDVYVFCCFTGLSYADVAKLERSEISVGVDDGLGFLPTVKKRK